VFYAPHRRPEHANREPLVLQTPPQLSMQVGWLRDFGLDGDQERKYNKPSGLTGETSGKKRRLLKEEGDISQND
jgi:hypothetical protein